MELGCLVFLFLNIYKTICCCSPNLGWRDIQHLVVRTSTKSSVLHGDGWKTNGAGLQFNPQFGFGIMNADRIVKAAKKYTTNVGEQLTKQFDTTEESRYVHGVHRNITNIYFWFSHSDHFYSWTYQWFAFNNQCKHHISNSATQNRLHWMGQTIPSVFHSLSKIQMSITWNMLKWSATLNINEEVA